MKKLLIIITLFVSSFFFISIEDAKADTTTVTFKDYSLVSCDDFTNVKLLAEEILPSTNYSHYFIVYFDVMNNPSNSSYYVFYFKSSTLYSSIDKKISSTSYDYSVSLGPGYSQYRYNSSTGKLSLYSSSASSYTLYFTSYALDNGLYHYYLYSDVPVIYSYYLTNVDFKINYPHNTYIFNNENLKTEIPSLYSEYVLNEGTIINPNNPHQEEIDKVTNFYTMVIEKISYLANEISNNYILLFVIGIFIVTFVFLLIFRRFL